MGFGEGGGGFRNLREKCQMSNIHYQEVKCAMACIYSFKDQGP